MRIVTRGPARCRPPRLFLYGLLAGFVAFTSATRLAAGQNERPPNSVQILVPGVTAPQRSLGLVISGAGHILASASALGAGNEIHVVSQAPGEAPVGQPAQLIASDPQTDLALLQAGDTTNLFPAGLGDSAVAAPARGRPAARLQPGEAQYGPDGYVVGFMARPRDGDNPGVPREIPVNTVKDFLEAHGLAAFLPPRLQLGSATASDGKGLQLAPVAGLADAWPGRTRWVSPESGDGLSLRIDRLYAETSLPQLEQELLAGRAFDAFPAEPVQRLPSAGGSLAGSAAGVGDRDHLAVEFLLRDLRNERIVARYVGPADLVAYNRSTLRHSLESIAAAQMQMSELRPTSAELAPILDWTAQGGPKLSAPAGWLAEPVATRIPSGYPPPDLAVEISPPNDYTVVLRALFWFIAPASPAVGARTEPSGGSTPVDQYSIDDTSNGVVWRHEGRYRAEGGALLLLEASAPAAKAALAGAAARAWLAQ